MGILIGTSGYSYDDWKKKFYPPLIKTPEMLTFYAKFFRMTEINSSYYRIPPRQMMEYILEKVPEDFIFTVKVFKGITHERPEDADRLILDFNQAIGPLVERGKCACLLLQFPYSFHNTQENQEYLLQMKGKFSAPLVAEFRNSGWITESTFAMLEEQKIGFCCVDEPRLKGLIPPEARVTSDIGYVRFHGRNAQTWFAKDGTQYARYDYLYGEEELMEWVPKIKAMAGLTKTFFVLFNNHPKAYAVRNAELMAKLLDIPLPAIPKEEDYDSSLNKFL
jgi:uncharacterized protein YecE (DUF72 family)